MLKLAVTVRDSALRISHDVTVQMEETRPVSALVTDLLAHLDWPMEYMDGSSLNYNLLVERSGRTLTGGEPLSVSGILEGDILILAPVPGRPSGPVAAGRPAAPPLARRPEPSRGRTDYPSSRQTGSNETIDVDQGKTIFLSLPSAGLRVLSAAGNPGKAISITREETIIGRGEDCHLVLEDRAASRHHARIVYLEPEYWLEDLNSANGTMLGDRPVSRECLRDGTTITVGKTVLLFNLG